jgi:hypothetical protein
MTFITNRSDSIDIQLSILPRSSENKIVGLMDDRLKLKLKAPPVDGAANKMCIQFFSKLLKVPKSHIEIVSGQTSRKKKIRIMGKPEKLKLFFQKLISS